MRTNAAALVCLLVTGACATAGGGASPTPDPNRISYDSGAADLVVRVSTAGGFVPQHFHFTHVPEISLYGDGRLVTQGAQIAIFPGPAMPPLIETRTNDAGIQRILRAAKAAGLFGPDQHYPARGVADAPTTTFTVAAGGGIHRVSAEALGIDAAAPGMPETERQARKLLTAFREDMGDVRGRLGTDVVGPERPYAATAIRIGATEGDPKTADEPELAKIVNWPLPQSLATFGEPWPPMPGMRCGVLEAADLERVRPALTASHTLTFWKSGGKTYQLWLRPLLPDEHGCRAPS
jgi:hypothetical protein